MLDRLVFCLAAGLSLADARLPSAIGHLDHLDLSGKGSFAIPLGRVPSGEEKPEAGVDIMTSKVNLDGPTTARRSLQQTSSVQSGVNQVDPEELAVLPTGFKRQLADPWQNTSIPTANGLSSNLSSTLGLGGKHFLSFGSTFTKLLGDSPVLETLAERDYNFAHEGPVYLPDTNEVFFVSNRLGNLSTEAQYVELYAVNLTSGDVREIIPSQPVPLANGAVSYEGGIALLAQGHKTDGPGGVIYLDPYSGEWHWLLNNWFGLEFNSPNDIVHTTASGALWFTDPTYASNQGFKGIPQLGEFVWRFIPGGPPARVVAGGFTRPNGLALSADQATMFVSDTGFTSGASNQAPDPSEPHTIYAYDIITHNGGEFLANKRVFAVNDNGIPDGVKLDRDGNVYSGCGDGLNVWAASGDLIGKIAVDGGISNFCFAGNDLIMLAETKILKLHLLCSGTCAASQ